MSIWIYEGQLRIEYHETLLARYRCAYDQRQRRLRDVSQPVVYQTRFASPQLELLDPDDAQWVKVQQRAFQCRTRQVTQVVEQLPLLHLAQAALILPYVLGEGVRGNFFPYVSTVI